MSVKDEASPPQVRRSVGYVIVTVSTITDWLGRLEGVRKSGTGWKARCPAHDDRNPSLSVTEGAGGKVLVTCHAASDCTFEAIRDALWPRGSTSGAGDTRRAAYQRRRGRSCAA